MIALLAACLMNVRNAECNVACKNWGYEEGRWEDPYCLCIEKRKWEDTQESRIVLPTKKAKPSS